MALYIRTTYVRMYIHELVYPYISMCLSHTCTCTYVCVCMHVRACVLVCMCLFMYCVQRVCVSHECQHTMYKLTYMIPVCGARTYVCSVFHVWTCAVGVPGNPQAQFKEYGHFR